MTMNRVPFRLSSGQIAAWSCGEIGLTLHVVIISMYGLYVLTESMHLGPVRAGATLLLPKLWNILLDPWVGRALDRRPRWRRPWLLGGSLLWGSGFGLAFSLPGWWSPGHQDLAFFGALMVAATGQSIFQVPYTALTNDLGRHDGDRVRIISLKNIVSRLTVFGTAAAFPWLMSRAMQAPGDYCWIGLGTGMIIIANGLLALASIRGVDIGAGAAVPAGAGMGRGSFSIWRNPPYAFLLLTYGLYSLGQLPFVGLLVYYLTLVMHRPPAMMTSLYPVAAMASVLATPVWAWLIGRYGKRRVCLAAWTGSAVAWSSPLWMQPGHGELLYPLMLVIGIFQAGGDLVPNVILPDVVDLGQRLSGRQPRPSTLYGIWIGQQQLVLALGGMVTSLALSLSGYDPAQGAARRISRIPLAMGLPSMLLALAAVVIMATRSGKAGRGASGTSGDPR